MKKVIGIQQFEQIHPEKLLLYQQIEYFTYWLYDIQEKNTSAINNPSTTMDQLIEIKSNLQMRQNNQLEDIKKELCLLKSELINYSQLFGIDSIERLLLAEIGIIAAKEFNKNCIETLIFLNQITQPISYEKKRFSPRSEFEEPDNCVNELCIDNHVWVAYETKNPLNVTIWIRYEDQLIKVKGRKKTFLLNLEKYSFTHSQHLIYYYQQMINWKKPL